ncbi:Lsr2 family protein [Glaciihabitans sp. dw_435]|uniref:histone-like nucleoid-structuring protein Lsr2 n=1 Tax=Glaciihabitans sp. dw_435 TaxID=2720081 RepID=UPI001BD6B8A9|nr:Lsr2 family protein [Glaciihabitans sp. dw_435]
MAQKITVQLFDDISHEIIEDGQGETISFSLDGRSFEIDLSARHAEELRKSLAPYIENARSSRDSGGRASAGPAQNGTASSASIIREWAIANGVAVPSRGRIPAHVTTAYIDAHR